MSITLSTIKQALKIDYSTDDAELSRLRDAAISFITEYTGIALQNKSKVQFLPYWMRTRINTYPFNAITSVKFTNTSGTLTTMPTTDWFLDKSEEPSVFINFLEFPSVKEGTFIEVTYTTGYAVFPKEVEQLVISMIGAWYNNPEATAPITLSTVPLSAQFIMDNLKAKGSLT